MPPRPRSAPSCQTLVALAALVLLASPLNAQWSDRNPPKPSEPQAGGQPDEPKPPPKADAAKDQPKATAAPDKPAEPDAAKASAGVGVGLMIVLCVLGFAFYMLPTGIALLRKHPNVVPIAIVNFFLGWICVGWILALAWCFSAGPGQVVINQYGGRRRRPRDDEDDYDD